MATSEERQEHIENTIEIDLEAQRQTQQQQEHAEKTNTSHQQSTPEQEAEQEEEKPILGLNYEKPPKNLSSRYNCTALGEYLDKKGNFVFKDTGHSIATSRDNTASVNDMLDVAESKGWTDIKLRGSKEFRRAAWLEAQSRGLGTKGYTPDERDLATLRDNLGQRQSNTIERDGQEINPPQATAQPVPEPEIGKKLIGHGEAPYLFNNDNAASYYATLETSDGTQVTMWGVGIKAALEEHEIGQGDKIDLQKGGKVATTIQVPSHDEAGNVTGYQDKQVYRNEWKVDVLERATQQPDITAPSMETENTKEPQPASPSKAVEQEEPVTTKVSSRAQQMMEEAQQFQKEKEIAAQAGPESAQQTEVPPPVSSRVQQMREETQQFQKEIDAQELPEQHAQMDEYVSFQQEQIEQATNPPRELQEEKQANKPAPEKDQEDDLGLREGEANKLQAQNEMPTLAQINTSPKADVDSDVRFKDVGGQSIPSELSNDVQSWVNNPTPKQSRLNGRDKRVVSMMKLSVQDTLSALEPNARKQALRNYNENLDAAINGTTLNVPEHLKQELQQQNQPQAQHQQAQQRQVTPPIRGQEPELEL